MNYKELKKDEKLNSEVENQGGYTAQSVEKIDKSKINMEVFNKIIAFKNRTQFGESVVKQNKLFKGGDLT